MLRKLCQWLVSNQKGQVGTAPDSSSSTSTPSSSTEPVGDSGGDVGGDGGGTTDTGGGTAGQESFIDPSQLPEELKPHWRRMHRAYTQRLESIRDLQNKRAEITKFYQDPNFAREVIQRWVGQYGYQLTPRQAAQAAQAAQAGPTGGDPQLVEAVKQQLDPSLHWMAPALANAVSAITKQQGGAYQDQLRQAIAPLYQQNQQQVLQQRGVDYDRLAEELTNIAPGWEEHEDTMSELVDFMSSNALSHPKFGSKLQLLYNAVSGNAAATSTAINRMKGAVRSKGAAKPGIAPSQSNLQDRIKKAPNMRSAWELVKQNALKET